MPEYADIEIMANELNTAISGCAVISVDQSDWYAKRSKGEEHDFSQVLGWKMSSVIRIGKALLLAFEKPRYGNRYLASRLGMSGCWRVYSADYKWRDIKGWAAALTLQHKQGKIALVYTDTRRFGTIEIRRYVHDIESLRTYGPEIRSSQFTREWVEFCCSRHKTPIKALLLEQRYFAGFNNAMASEVLFNANIYPFISANELSKYQLRRLFEAIHLTINTAITERGLKVEHESLNVYGREKRPCLVCGVLIKKASVGKKMAYWCPECQSPTWRKPPPVDKSFVDDVIRAVSFT